MIDINNFKVLTQTDLDNICKLDTFKKLMIIERGGVVDGFVEYSGKKEWEHLDTFVYLLDHYELTDIANNISTCGITTPVSEENTEKAFTIFEEVVRCCYHDIQDMEHKKYEF